MKIEKEECINSISCPKEGKSFLLLLGRERAYFHNAHDILCNSNMVFSVYSIDI